MQEFNPSNELPCASWVTPTRSDTVEEISSMIPFPSTGNYAIASNMPFGGTISGITFHAGAGTGTATVTIGDVTVTGLSALAISTTRVAYLATGANSFDVGNDIVVNFTAISSLSNLSITVSVIRSLPSCTTNKITTAAGTVLDGSKEENIVYALSNGVTSYTIPFAVAKTDTGGLATTNYSVFAENPVENLVDDASLEIFARVVGRTSTGLTILLSANPDSANYVYRANIKVI